jgi:hypothetical protein
MKKRHLLQTLGALSASALPLAAQAHYTPPTLGPTLLTITGAIGRNNRGALDPALDQLMVKHKVSFPHAWTMDSPTLQALPAVTIQPTLEYDSQRHRLRGPLLSHVLGAARVKLSDVQLIILRALDGYAVQITPAQAEQYRFIIATELDGKPLPLGGLGPLWAVFEPDAYADMKARALNERFVQCPWGLYHIEVQAA